MALRVCGGFYEEGPARTQSWASRLGQEGLSVRDLSVGLSSYLGRKFISALNTVGQLFCAEHRVGEWNE